MNQENRHANETHLLVINYYFPETLKVLGLLAMLGVPVS